MASTAEWLPALPLGPTTAACLVDLSNTAPLSGHTTDRPGLPGAPLRPLDCGWMSADRPSSARAFPCAPCDPRPRALKYIGASDGFSSARALPCAPCAPCDPRVRTLKCTGASDGPSSARALATVWVACADPRALCTSSISIEMVAPRAPRAPGAPVRPDCGRSAASSGSHT